MKNIKILSVLFIFISLLVSFQCQNNKEAKADRIEVSGLIEAIDTDVRAQVQGEIISMNVEEGQFVHKDEMLCLLDSEKLLIKLKQLDASLEGARSKLRLFKKGTKKELVAVAKNQLETAEKEYEQAEIDQKRIANLYQEGAVSASQKDQADLRLKAARERFQSAEQNYKLAFRGREREEIDMVHSEIQNLEAQKELFERQIKDTRILAPDDGIVETRHIETGELAFPGSLLFTLIDLDRTYVKAYVPEKYIGKIRLGTKVELTCDSFADQTFEGKVHYISDQAEFAPKNIQTKEERLKLVFMIKAYIPNENRILKPGMPVDATLFIDSR